MVTKSFFPEYKEEKWNTAPAAKRIFDCRKMIREARENTLYSRDAPMIQEKKEHLLFVYGSLKAGFRNDHMLSLSRFIGPAWTKGDYFEMYKTYGDNCFPVILCNSTSKRKARVYGEVYAVPSSDLFEIDYLENNGLAYKRLKLPFQVIERKGSENTVHMLDCWTYIGINKYWESKMDFLSPLDRLVTPKTAGKNPQTYYSFKKSYETDD